MVCAMSCWLESVILIATYSLSWAYPYSSTSRGTCVICVALVLCVHLKLFPVTFIISSTVSLHIYNFRNPFISQIFSRKLIISECWGCLSDAGPDRSLFKTANVGISWRAHPHSSHCPHANQTISGGHPRDLHKINSLKQTDSSACDADRNLSNSLTGSAIIAQQEIAIHFFIGTASNSLCSGCSHWCWVPQLSTRSTRDTNAWAASTNDLKSQRCDRLNDKIYYKCVRN